ncbi:MFS transporter [Candidatus Saccharibacteria bacterium]|nr:MFS transporter [Candidatus Saccharibacteria bacterium]
MKPLFTHILHRLLWRQHFWRHIGFSELAELYALRMLRSVAINMIGIFVAVYLFRNGYSIMFILGFFAVYYLVRALSCVPAAYIIGYIGPKHATLLSNIMFLPSFIALYLIPELGSVMLLVYLVPQAFGNALFNISYNVDFSKVKHGEHAGKEIGFMQIMDRIGTALSPLIGGLIALAFGPQVTIIVALALFVVAAIPLFFTPEPVETHRRVHLRHFPWREYKRPLLSQVGIGADVIASSIIWPLFLVLVVFTSGSDEVYAQIGGIASVTIFASLIIAKIYGTLIDKRRGKQLLAYSVIGNSSLHLVRFLIGTPLAAVAFNIINEVMTTGYYMPYMKGLYDTADRDEEFRVTYLAVSDIVASLGGIMLLLIAMACIAITNSEVVGFQVQYVMAALMTLLIAAHGFPIYKRSH